MLFLSAEGKDTNIYHTWESRPIRTVIHRPPEWGRAISHVLPA